MLMALQFYIADLFPRGVRQGFPQTPRVTASSFVCSLYPVGTCVAVLALSCLAVYLISYMIGFPA